MAINKKLIHFKSKENFDKEVANNNILDTSICFIQDSQQIWTHGQVYNAFSNMQLVDTSEEVDDVEQDIYVKYIPQNLTEEQQEQARQNINCPSVADIIDQIGETKKSISILFVGNSLTQDGIAYLPYMLKTYYPEVDFKLYMWYIGGYTLGQHYETFTSGGYANIFSVAENTTSWTNYSKNKTMAWVLQNFNFDLVCMQEYFNYKTSYEEATDWNLCRDYIVSNYKGGNALEFISLFHAPLRKDGYDVHEVYKNTEAGNALILQSTISDDVIPNGIAVYRALDTDLNNLGDLKQLSPDGTHTQEGLPCLLQTYVTLCWLFDRLGINKSVYGHPMRMTTAIYNTLNVPGANLGKGVVQGTDAQNLLAQEVAIKAYKEGKQFLMKNLYPFEWGSGSSGGGGTLFYCTFTITTNVEGAIIKINGVEQSSITVLAGSTVNWEVTKDEHYSQNGSEIVSSDITKNVILEPIISVVTLTTEFNQGEYTVFNEQELSDLKPMLKVTAYYVDGTNKEINDYVLSGNLDNEVSSISVEYGGKSSSFDVNVTPIVIPEEYTRYGYLETKANAKPSSNPAPSKFIYLTEYEDWNTLSMEAMLGYKSNVELGAAGPGILGSRLASGDGTCWYGLYAQASGVRVDIHNSNNLVPWPADTNKFKLTVNNPRTSPGSANINNGETSVVINWTKEEVIPHTMSLFNNIPYGSTSNMSQNWGIKIGDLCFRDYEGRAVRYYVPAVKNNIIGMYEVLSGTFCTAQTASACTVGNSAQLWKTGNW